MVNGVNVCTAVLQEHVKRNKRKHWACHWWVASLESCIALGKHSDRGINVLSYVCVCSAIVEEPVKQTSEKRKARTEHVTAGLPAWDVALL